MIIGIDFDGTCVTHDFPRVGKDVGAVPVLKQLIASGHELVLFTMRSDKDDISPNLSLKSGPYLTDAINWFKENEIPLYGIQANPTQSIWTDSPKAYCQLLIDDTGLGCPLVFDKQKSDRPFVDWVEVKAMLENCGVL